MSYAVHTVLTLWLLALAKETMYKNLMVLFCQIEHI